MCSWILKIMTPSSSLSYNDSENVLFEKRRYNLTCRLFEEFVNGISRTCKCAMVVVSFLLASAKIFGYVLDISKDGRFNLRLGVLLQG